MQQATQANQNLQDTITALQTENQTLTGQVQQANQVIQNVQTQYQQAQAQQQAIPTDQQTANGGVTVGTGPPTTAASIAQIEQSQNDFRSAIAKLVELMND